MSEKHTAGEWMFQGIHPFSTPDGKFLNWSAFRISARSLDPEDTDYYFIGTVSNVNDAPENKANAQLFCAAPKMLLALRRAALALAFAAESSAAMQDDYEAVSAAIALATNLEQSA